MGDAQGTEIVAQIVDGDEKHVGARPVGRVDAGQGAEQQADGEEVFHGGARRRVCFFPDASLVAFVGDTGRGGPVKMARTDGGETGADGPEEHDVRGVRPGQFGHGARLGLGRVAAEIGKPAAAADCAVGGDGTLAGRQIAVLPR